LRKELGKKEAGKMTNQVNIACGTDDGVNFTDEHFGSAKFYLIYTLDLETRELRYTKKIENTSPQEEVHGDPIKAHSISELLKDVQVLMGSVMGPNIVRIRKRFTPVISRGKNIEDAIKKLKEKASIIKKNLKIPTGKDKKTVYID